MISVLEAQFTTIAILVKWCLFESFKIKMEVIYTCFVFEDNFPACEDKIVYVSKLITEHAAICEKKQN